MTDRLGVGFIGSGFNARFHIQSFTGVRDADVRGVWSPNAKNAKAIGFLFAQPLLKEVYFTDLYLLTLIISNLLFKP